MEFPQLMVVNHGAARTLCGRLLNAPPFAGDGFLKIRNCKLLGFHEVLEPNNLEHGSIAYGRSNEPMVPGP